MQHAVRDRGWVADILIFRRLFALCFDFSIGSSAFDGCSSLTSVTIPNSVTSIGDYPFLNCSSLDTLNFLANVETIAKSVISGCYNLKSLAISSSVTSIEDSAFASCKNIRVITCYATTPPDITSTTFANYDATLYVPASCVDVYSSTIYWRYFYIQAIPDEPAALEYSLADRNVIYLNGKVYNTDGLEIKLYDTAGRLISSGDSDIEMSSCPSGIYIVTDGKGGFLKINHYR